ncbi:MAG: DUF2292 domain-containing protein [Defluviitaleaceae bacterium]|nr:DUF2292 domain-containing protein [Defluviitaleaceae bacterium]
MPNTTAIPIEKIVRKIEEVQKGSGYGRIEIHIQNSKIIRTEKIESEMEETAKQK